MNILATIDEKVAALGIKEVASLLGVRESEIKDYQSGKRKPSLETCQTIVDEWFIESRPFRSEDKLCNLWENKGVCILMPTYKSLHPFTHYAVISLFDRSTMCYEQRAGDSMIARSRNHLARRFLRDTKAEWSIWIDDDMIPPFGNGPLWANMTGMKIPDKFASFNAITRLVSWKRSIVGAVYFDRWGKGTYTAGFDRGIPVRLPHDTVFPVRFMGTGCLLVHRKVYEDIAAKFPETYNPNAPGNESGFFTELQGKDGRMWGEDESFGWRALQCGHQSFMDLGLICGHVGEAVRGLQ